MMNPMILISTSVIRVDSRGCQETRQRIECSVPQRYVTILQSSCHEYVQRSGGPYQAAAGATTLSGTHKGNCLSDSRFALTLERQRHRGSRSERNGICDLRQSLSFAPTMKRNVAFLHESHAVSYHPHGMRRCWNSQRARRAAREPHRGSRCAVVLPRGRVGRAHDRAAWWTRLRHFLSSA